MVVSHLSLMVRRIPVHPISSSSNQLKYLLEVKLSPYININSCFLNYPKRFCHAVKEYNDNLKEPVEEKRNTFGTKHNIENGPGLKEFIANVSYRNPISLSKREQKKISHPYISPEDLDGHGQTVFFKVYGCQMNSSDAEVAWSILKGHGYALASSIENANIILIVTCAIRESAETKVWNQLTQIRSIKNKTIQTRKNVKIGVLGCMAERIGLQLLEREKIVDIVAGPDSYKDLPRLLALTREGEKTINVLLSHDETYANVNPISLSLNKVSAFVSIMRGCNNMCSYCIVPFTRGRERSRDMKSIINEVKLLSNQGIKEITLLGQNVNSYRDTSEINHPLSTADTTTVPLAKGFKTIYKNVHTGKRFADLLDRVSDVDPEMRIRFTSPHPKDFPDEVLYVIKERSNICNCIHLPAQSGSTRILQLMQRGYTKEAYLELVWHIKSIIPNVSLTSDFICGFCSETEEDFEDTLTLLQKVQYNFCYVFPYSMREKTLAHRRLEDDVPSHIKTSRLQRIASLFREISLRINLSQIGQRQLVLVEGISKRSSFQLAGRNDGNTKVIIPDVEIPVRCSESVRNPSAGDFVEVIVTDATSQVLKGTPICISSLSQFSDSPV